MPFTLTYYLTTPSPSSAVLGAAGFPGSSAKLVCDAESFDQQHFLDLIDRLLPEEYLRPLKANKDAGYEIMQALAATAEQLSTAMHDVECGLVMLYADGPTSATVSLTLYRENANAGAVTVLAGSIMTTSHGDRAFALTADAVFGALTLSVVVQAQAVIASYESNVRGQRVTAGGEVLPGEIDTVFAMVQSPSFGDPTIMVKQEADALGGYPDWLALHGDNRGLTQSDQETNDAFRGRMRALPDTVTPAAMRRLAARILDPLGIAWQFIETFQVGYVTCWDAPSPNVGTPSYQVTPPTSPLYNPNLLFWYGAGDRESLATRPFRGRWLDSEDYQGGFIIAVERDYTILDDGFAFDDPGTLYSDFIGAQGKTRGTPAFDAPDPSALYAAAAFDGSDVIWSSAVANLVLEAQTAKPAGSSAIVDFYHFW